MSLTMPLAAIEKWPDFGFAGAEIQCNPTSDMMLNRAVKMH